MSAVKFSSPHWMRNMATPSGTTILRLLTKVRLFIVHSVSKLFVDVCKMPARYLIEQSIRNDFACAIYIFFSFVG